MTQQNHNEQLEAFEVKAQELVSMTFALCESQLAQGPKTAEPPQKALAAAALCVRESVKTFVAVSSIPTNEGR